MSNAYATVEELAARWRPIGSDEREMAETLLEDASTEIDRWVNVDDLCDRKAALVPIICCEMVKRAMKGEQQNADLFTTPEAFATWESMTPARRPTMTRQEKIDLGVGSRVGSWSM